MRIEPIISKNANNGGVSIGTSTTNLIEFNYGRKGILITNTGAYGVWLNFSASGMTALVNQGAYLASGGTAQIDINGPLWFGAIDAIAVGGASLVTYVEFI
jgi:hypothetical protein